MATTLHRNLVRFGLVTPGFMRPEQGRRQVKECAMDTHGECTECEPITGVWEQSPHGLGQSPQPPSPRVKTYRVCINFRNDLWQKWGGHVHLSPPRGDAPGPECVQQARASISRLLGLVKQRSLRATLLGQAGYTLRFATHF